MMDAYWEEARSVIVTTYRKCEYKKKEGSRGVRAHRDGLPLGGRAVSQIQFGYISQLSHRAQLGVGASRDAHQGHSKYVSSIPAVANF